MYGHSTLQTGTELMKYICNENNKDVKHIPGNDPRNQLGLNGQTDLELERTPKLPSPGSTSQK